MNVSICLSEAANIAVHVAEIEVLVTVTVVCAVDEYVGCALDEMHGITWLDELVVVFCKESLDELACHCIIYIHAHVFLAAVENLYEDL